MFQFKQFTIHQDKTSMKVGTDGVLLGAWCKVERARNILDIGTGTGLLAIMVAQLNPFAEIVAIEIEENAVNQAIENVANSPWKDRILVRHSSIQDFNVSNKFDAIVCNPPYFNNSTKNIDKGETLARHNDSLSLVELIERVSQLLTVNGIFSVILPVVEAKSLIELAESYCLYLSAITYVYPTPDKGIKRYLMSFSFKKESITEEHLVIEYSRHIYSDEYKKLTKDFYL